MHIAYNYNEFHLYNCSKNLWFSIFLAFNVILGHTTFYNEGDFVYWIILEIKLLKTSKCTCPIMQVHAYTLAYLDCYISLVYLVCFCLAIVLWTYLVYLHAYMHGHSYLHIFFYAYLLLSLGLLCLYLVYHAYL